MQNIVIWPEGMGKTADESCAEYNLTLATDETQLAFAQGRVIFTQDTDFLRLAAAGVPHAGIV